MKSTRYLITFIILANTAFAGDPDGGNWIIPICESLIFYFLGIAQIVL